jgi:hypothetical protein
MSRFSIALLAGVAAIFGATAQAAPLMSAAPGFGTGVEQVRTVCNDSGRCVDKPERRAVVQPNRGTVNRAYNSYNYDRGPSFAAPVEHFLSPLSPF